jgi:signal transduction histidine kinase
MSRRPSLRSSLVVGAVLWTIGIIAVVNVLSLTLVHHFPREMGVVHWTLLSVLAGGLIVAGLSQVRRGLSPINQLRARLAALRDGRARRVEGEYPAEVQPLVDDLNVLLVERDLRVTRALEKAGDFAHGLKTPLAVLAQEAERIRAGGGHALADRLDEAVERMRRQVDYHLAQTRAAASKGAADVRCQVAVSVEGLARTMRRMHADRGVAFDVAVAPDHVVRVRREDLDEMLGNLLDNACKWARSRVRVASSAEDGGIVIDIDDDGPGLEPSMREVVLQRGVRADEAAPGSGLGLAIVRDLAELYGGAIALGESPFGGLRGRLRLPGAAPRA